MSNPALSPSRASFALAPCAIKIVAAVWLFRSLNTFSDERTVGQTLMLALCFILPPLWRESILASRQA